MVHESTLKTRVADLDLGGTKLRIRIRILIVDKNMKKKIEGRKSHNLSPLFTVLRFGSVFFPHTDPKNIRKKSPNPSGLKKCVSSGWIRIRNPVKNTLASSWLLLRKKNPREKRREKKIYIVSNMWCARQARAQDFCHGKVGPLLSFWPPTPSPQIVPDFCFDDLSIINAQI